MLSDRPAASQDAAGMLSSLQISLSPGIVLLVMPVGQSDIDLAGVILRSAEGPVVPPVSWQRLETAFGPSLVLLARVQPALATGARLSITDRNGATLEMAVTPPVSLPHATEGLSAAAVLALLHFIASKATGTLRHSDDEGLAETCHAAARAVLTPDRTAVPVALCGIDMVMWTLPDTAPARSATCYALSPRRFRRVQVSGSIAILRDRQFEDGFLLMAGTAGPVHLASAGGRLPALAELGRSKDVESRTFYRRGIAELARRAPTDAAAQRLLRDLQLLAPTAKAHRIMQPARPFGAALELGICDHGGGAFIRGWLRDPLKIVSGLTLRSDYGELRLDPTLLGRFARPDVAETYRDSPFGGIEPKAGFVAHLPDVAIRPVAQWGMRVELTTGDSAMLVAPPAILHPRGAREAVLSAVPPAEITPDLLERCIAPAVAPLHAAVLAQVTPPEVIGFGTQPANPALSIIVPLYRNLRFLRHQYASFARDPAVRAVAELIFVLDSPEQQADVAHALRGFHGLYDMPITLIVQGSNFGYASACNAGAAAARGGILLMLNSDVVPVGRGWLQPLLEALGTDSSLVAVGPKLLFEDDSLQHAGLFFERGAHGEWYNNHYFKGFPRYYPAAMQARRVPGVTGAALCVRRAAYEAVGGFTTDYVIGDYEDSDLCLKLREKGGEIGYVPGAELYHFERQSIRDHTGYTHSLASAYNRQMHHRRWASAMESLMAEIRTPASHAPDRDGPG